VNLQRTAQAVVERFGGTFPDSVSALRELPGIGPYTAGAIACFAFEQDTAFFDTNIKRVIHRVFFGVDVPRPTASDKAITGLAAEAVPTGNGWTWNQALIEFGALQCTARKPACVICPLQRECAAFPEIQTAIGLLPKGVRLKKEAPFEGSNRFYRGRVIATLREAGDEGVTLAELGPSVRPEFSAQDLPWLYTVVEGLAKDGLTVIAEESAEYDAGELGQRLVRLP
jgi:A/G-specific adenine glycosylase